MIANHILVSFHVAFISSVVSIPATSLFKRDVLEFIFLSPETLVSAVFMYITFHTGIAVHELGHYLTAARLNALNDASQEASRRVMSGPVWRRTAYLVRAFILAPFGRASGIKREGLNYYPDAPYNLAVAAAGPRASRNLAMAFLIPAAALLIAGIGGELAWAIYVGRLCLGIGLVGFLDFRLADPGKYNEFRERERRARQKAAAVAKGSAWWNAVGAARKSMLEGRIQRLKHPRLGRVTAPWQYRNCGMGGRHTEKEYPESNISMQEAMFLILGARDYQEAQEMTVRLQNRLKEMIENEEGCRVMGIGLEGGLAPYIDRGPFPLPEIRLWSMMKQTIQECGYRPGVDVAIALDPAASELENAYRKQFNVPDSVGMYLFWRDKTQIVMDRDGVLDVYVQAIQKYDIPILSIEDGFSEDDFEGWQKLLATLGDRVFVIGDDLVTTNDKTIETAASQGLINTVLIKANQIGTLYETILAMLVSLGKGFELVVSHRSKSPNDDMEAQIALAMNALGLKAGGGANTERLVKYHAVTELMQRGLDDEHRSGLARGEQAVVRKLFAYEEPTNAGIPSVGATVELALPAAGLHLDFKGATPLGTSAGTGEAIHLVDSAIEFAEHREVVERHGDLFREQEAGVLAFARGVTEQQVESTGDDDLVALYERTQRYDGKGCLNAVDHVTSFIAPAFQGRDLARLTLKDIDRTLLSLELRVARRRGKLANDAPAEARIMVMQRKQNLGMNAVLSVSLALARGVAHLQGKDLYELIREEVLSIIEQLAERHRVEISGGQLEDYARALEQINAKLEVEGASLYEALRDLTGVYEEVESLPVPGQIPDAAGEPGVRGVEPTESARPVSLPGNVSEQEQPPSPPDATTEPPHVGVAEVLDQLKPDFEDLHRNLYKVYRADADPAARQAARLQYVMLKQQAGERLGQFGLAHNRVFVGGNHMWLPYILDHTLAVFRAPDASAEPVYAGPVDPGVILTDAAIQEAAGFSGTAIDLEGELFEFDAARCGPVRVGRIRDMTEQLHRIRNCSSRNDAVYLLRILVARLSLFSFKKYLSAKNLQSEVRNLQTELLEFVNTPLARRLPFLVRILVRNISGVVTKPKLIDRLWNDTIDLAEVHLRGSDIVNEIRRSTHHAVGRRSLELVRHYLDYLESGQTTGLAEFGYPEPGPTDRAARGQEQPKIVVARILSDLEELLGSADIVGRVREWQAEYAATLLRCESDHSLQDEVEKVITDSIGECNRWTYYHHLRIIRNRARQFVVPARSVNGTMSCLNRLLTLKPDDADFDADRVSSELRDWVSDFVGLLQGTYQRPLFDALDRLTASYTERAYIDTFTQSFELRKDLRTGLEQQAFPEQRLMLYELDCLLEEMGYVALRHVASGFEEEGVNLARCIEIIRGCALNLTHDGLHSRQLLDLVGLLSDPSRTYAELSNVLEQIQRNYQHLLRRLIAPFEHMRSQLGLDAEELRISLANLQRFLHDLNSMVAFTDMARQYIEGHIPDLQVRIDGEPAMRNLMDTTDEVVHLSDHEAIGRLARGRDPVSNVRGAYGGKGSGLIYISHLDIPTPDGFILPTSMARRRLIQPEPDWLHAVVDEHLQRLEVDLEHRSGLSRRLGSTERPLLVAVRGGSVFSMPGMLATILFVGMNDEIAEALAADDPWHAYDSYRRFLASFGRAVWGVDVEKSKLVDRAKERHGVEFKDQLPWEAMRDIARETKIILEQRGFGEALEQVLHDPRCQLRHAAHAVLDSWNTETARRYRDLKGICDTWQTALIVQHMAFGNRRNENIQRGMDETAASLTGVIPRTLVDEWGVRTLAGDFKFSACGDDLVGGLTRSVSLRPMSELGEYMPMLNRRLRHTVAKLRRFMGTDQEIEFTVERGVLSVLQSRAAEIGANRRLYRFRITGEELTHGVGIRGSAFRGMVAFDEEDIQSLEAARAQRQDVDGILLLLENPTPDDLPLILRGDGLLAARGGSTAHAAIAVNGIEGKDFSAVMGADGLRVDARNHEAVLLDGERQVRARIRTGDVLSIHGSTGAVYEGTRDLEQV